ncbi:MAG: dihydroxyacetone kinase subunit DhaL, partial [Eubacterium sp.]
MAATKKDVLTFVDLFNNKMEEHRQALTDMDQAIGDGDHGINMNRGMKAVEEKIGTVADKPIADILKSVGMTLVSTVGGASGPLYGTAFMKAGMAMKGKEELSASDISEMFDAAIAGIISRGKATTGEKTMLDALVPAKDAYNAAIAEGKSITDALVDAEDAAWKGVEYTKTIIATKGRASYLGERSIGFQDPGATSVTYLI